LGLKILANKQRFVDIHAELTKAGQLVEENPESPIIPLSPTKSTWKMWAAAASVVLVLGVAWYAFLQPSSSPSSSELAQQVDEKEDTVVLQTKPEVPNVAVESQKIPTSDKPSLKGLFEQDFDPNPSLTSPFSQEKMGMNPGLLQVWETETAAFFKGIDLLEKGDAKAALVLFEKTEQSRFDELRPYGEWYGVLALIKIGNVELLLEKVKKISQTDGHLYQQRAKNMLKRIQSEIQ
jgi:hypothetical protein